MEQFLTKYSLHGNWVDAIFILVVVYFLLTNRGFIFGILEVLGFLTSLIFSYKFYPFFGALLFANFSLPKGISYAIGFFMAWFLIETGLYFLLAYLSSKLLVKFHDTDINRYLGMIPAVLQACLMFLFFISLTFALPVRGQIKQDILDSKVGPAFVNLSQNLQVRMKNVLGGALSESINFLTIKPQSEEAVDLGFKVNASQLSVDQQSEDIMFSKVNQERTNRGIRALTRNDQLTDLARSYAKVMLENGFFSHISAVDGTSPGDRATRAGYFYLVLGENLAFAPDVYLAHQGLMNSEGHRKNILSEDYAKVGIGVVDAGIYGKMFVQEFSN